MIPSRILQLHVACNRVPRIPIKYKFIFKWNLIWNTIWINSVIVQFKGLQTFFCNEFEGFKAPPLWKTIKFEFWSHNKVGDYFWTKKRSDGDTPRLSLNKQMVEFCDSLISAFLWLFVCSLFLFKKNKTKPWVGIQCTFIHSFLRFSTLHIKKTNKCRIAH